MSDRVRCPSGLNGRWGEKAPRLKMRLYDRYRIEPGKVHELVVVSSRLETVYTHFVDGRTQLCTECNGNKCWIPHHLVSSRWSGWLAVCKPNSKVTMIVQITPGASESEPRLEDELISLRGMTLELRRLGNRPNGEVSARFIDEIAPVDDLPCEPNMRLAVWRILTAPDRIKNQDDGSFWRAYRAAQKAREQKHDRR